MIKKGFTILEVLVALAVFCIICAPVTSIVFKSLQINENSARIEKSNIYAKYVMEKLKNSDQSVLINLLHEKNKAALYSLYDERMNFDINPENYSLYRGNYRYYSDMVKPAEGYNDIMGKFISNENEQVFDGIVRVVLLRDDEHSVFICVSVWDKSGKDEYKSTLVSIRRIE